MNRSESRTPRSVACRRREADGRPPIRKGSPSVRKCIFISVFLGVVLITMMPGPGWSQQGTVSIYKVNGVTLGDTIPATLHVRFVMRYSNLTGGRPDVWNGFRISSPDGARWNYVTVDTLRRPGFSNGWLSANFNLAQGLLNSDRDGLGPDTAGVGLVMGTNHSQDFWKPGFDDSLFAVTVHLDGNSALGKHICIDSSFVGPAGHWMWPYFAQACEPVALEPTWTGLYPSQPEVPGYGFCFYIRDGNPELTLAGDRARRGSPKKLSVDYVNSTFGTLTNVTVVVTLPASVGFLENSPGGLHVGGTVIWNIGSLSPNQKGSQWVTVLVPSDAPLGSVLAASAIFNARKGDGSTVQWFADESEIVVGAVDPNEKLVTPAGTGPGHGISLTDTLRYQIFFQNVGTAEATNIVVRDSLSDLFDAGTFTLGATSHPCTFESHGQELIWTFSDINLPDSVSNEPGSHGFVTYRIAPRPDAIDGTVICNKAAIYFDFNPPVITNATCNTVATGCCSGSTGNVNMIGIVDLSDLSALVSYLTGGGFVLPCPAEANVNNVGIVDLSDLSALVGYLTGGGFVLPNCP